MSSLKTSKPYISSLTPPFALSNISATFLESTQTAPLILLYFLVIALQICIQAPTSASNAFKMLRGPEQEYTSFKDFEKTNPPKPHLQSDSLHAPSLNATNSKSLNRFIKK